MLTENELNQIKQEAERPILNRRGQIRVRFPSTLVTLNCSGCGKDFQRNSGILIPRKKYYCCRECSHMGNRKPNKLNKKLSNTFYGVKNRCCNPKDGNYYRYGGRGITIGDDINTVETFVAYISTLPNCPTKPNGRKITLDRIDNDKGYEKGNLRWTTGSIQSTNRRRRESKSGYTGIVFLKSIQKWGSHLTFKGIDYHFGCFDTIKDAIDARNKFIISNNFPHKTEKYEPL